jgi:bifunctional non-homologous end joining protein LigD
MQEAATLVRWLLKDLGLRSWLKTSGGKGLHLAVPLKQQRDHQRVKAVARAIADHLAHTIPKRFTAKSEAANRAGRVFVDYLRNGPAQTFEVACGQRTGFSDLLTVGESISLPIARADRQDRETAAKFALIEKAEGEPHVHVKLTLFGGAPPRPFLDQGSYQEQN